MTSRLWVRLLGSLEVWRDGQILPAAAWPGRKACQIFKILVRHRHRTVTRDELIEWLWPDLSPESARNSLWAAISRLRRLLEPEAAGRRGAHRRRLHPGRRLLAGRGAGGQSDARLPAADYEVARLGRKGAPCERRRSGRKR